MLSIQKIWLLTCCYVIIKVSNSIVSMSEFGFFTFRATEFEFDVSGKSVLGNNILTIFNDSIL